VHLARSGAPDPDPIGNPVEQTGKAVPGATKRGCSFLYRSTDEGKTWSRYAVVAAGGFNETGLARHCESSSADGQA
jgi:hypothetical protein